MDPPPSKRRATQTAVAKTADNNHNTSFGADIRVMMDPTHRSQEQQQTVTLLSAAPAVNRHMPPQPVTGVTLTATLDTYYMISKANVKDSQLAPHRRWLTLEKRQFEQKQHQKNKKNQQQQPSAVSGARTVASPTFHATTTAAAHPHGAAAVATKTPAVDGNAPTTVCAYKETDTHFLVPRAYGLSRWGRPSQDNTTLGAHRLDHVEFVGQLKTERPDQVGIANELLHYYTQTPSSLLSGILKLPTGSGKTVLMMHLIAQLKVPTLILLHREKLLRQTQKRIAKFLPAARIGIIQSKKCIVKDKDVVVGMLKSMGMRSYPREALDHFGLVIIDEVHNIATPVHIAALGTLRPRYMLGVSATPRRNNGLGDLLSWMVGPVIVERKRDWIPVHVRRIVYKRGLRKYHGNYNRAIMINRLAADSARNAYIVELVVALLMDKSAPRRRHILILSDRLEQVALLQDAIVYSMGRLIPHAGKEEPNAFIKALKSLDSVCNDTIRRVGEDAGADARNGNIDMSLYCFSVARYVGGKISPADEDAAIQCDVILGTYGVANDGIDVEQLDALIYGTPRSDVEQASGRILRPSDEKNVPIIVDIVDEGEKTEGMWWGRNAYYRYENMMIQQFEVV